jgi:type IV secretory pathway VirD2 relaxase
MGRRSLKPKIHEFVWHQNRRGEWGSGKLEQKKGRGDDFDRRPKWKEGKSAKPKQFCLKKKGVK